MRAISTSWPSWQAAPMANDRPARGAVGHHLAVQPPIVRQAEDPEIATQPVPQGRFLAEDQPPHPRVQPVSPHHQADAPRRAVLEAVFDAVVVLVQGADPVAELRHRSVRSDRRKH